MKKLFSTIQKNEIGNGLPQRFTDEEKQLSIAFLGFIIYHNGEEMDNDVEELYKIRNTIEDLDLAITNYSSELIEDQLGKYNLKYNIIIDNKNVIDASYLYIYDILAEEIESWEGDFSQENQILQNLVKTDKELLIFEYQQFLKTFPLLELERNVDEVDCSLNNFIEDVKSFPDDYTYDELLEKFIEDWEDADCEYTEDKYFQSFLESKTN